jgi:hypothetical protein
MRLASLTPAAIAVLLGGAVPLSAGIDFTARNERFQPGATVRLTTEKPSVTPAKVAVRSTPPRLTPAVSTAAESKHFRRVDVRPATAPQRPDVVPITPTPIRLSAWSGQTATISTAEASRPITVSRYQDSLAAASQVSRQRQPTVAPTRAVPLDRFAGAPDPTTKRDSQAVQRPAAATDRKP